MARFMDHSKLLNRLRNPSVLGRTLKGHPQTGEWANEWQTGINVSIKSCTVGQKILGTLTWMGSELDVFCGSHPLIRIEFSARTEQHTTQ